MRDDKGTTNAPTPQSQILILKPYAINIITSTQKFNALSPIIRVNSRQLFFFRLRNYKEIETMVEELSAVLIKKSSVADTKNLAEAKKLLLEVYN